MSQWWRHISGLCFLTSRAGVSHGAVYVIMTEGPKAADLPLRELQSSQLDSGHRGYPVS